MLAEYIRVLSIKTLCMYVHSIVAKSAK